MRFINVGVTDIELLLLIAHLNPTTRLNSWCKMSWSQQRRNLPAYARAPFLWRASPPPAYAPAPFLWRVSPPALHLHMHRPLFFGESLHQLFTCICTGPFSLESLSTSSSTSSWMTASWLFFPKPKFRICWSVNLRCTCQCSPSVNMMPGSDDYILIMLFLLTFIPISNLQLVLENIQCSFSLDQLK